MLTLPSSSLKVIIADDETASACGLQVMLSLTGISNFRTTHHCEQLPEMIKNDVPDLIFIEIMMNDGEGEAMVMKLLENFPDVRVIVYSHHSDSDCTERMCEAGVKGYLLKSDEQKDLEAAVHTVILGKEYFSPQIAKDAIHHHNLEKHYPFTQRDLNEITLLSQGLTSKEIGEEIHLSDRSVEHHFAHLCEMTDTKNGPELVAFCLHHHIIHYRRRKR